MHAYLSAHKKLHDMVFVFSLAFLFAVVLFRFRAGRHLPLNCSQLPVRGPSRLAHRLHGAALIRQYSHPSKPQTKVSHDKGNIPREATTKEDMHAFVCFLTCLGF